MLTAIGYVLIGVGVSFLIVILHYGSVLETLRKINDHYAAVLSACLSLVLIVITAAYVILTYLQARSTQESVSLNREFLRQSERQLMYSRVPTIVAEIVKAHGTAYFGARRRQIGIDWKLQNIGDGPALQIYAKMKLICSHAKFKDYDEMFEHSFVGNLAATGEAIAHLRFETAKVEKMIEDLNIKMVLLKQSVGAPDMEEAKRQTRLEQNDYDDILRGPALLLEVLYSNVHGKFFRTKVINRIFYLHVKERQDSREQRVYWMSDTPLQDEEAFELLPLNPIFSTFEFMPVEYAEAKCMIDSYRGLSRIFGGE